MENRLEAVYDKEELLMAAAYDGDGNRVFMLNYNLHTDEDWKGNSGNGNGSNKDNAGSGNSGNGNDFGSNGNSFGNNGNGNGNSSSNNGNASGNNGNGNSKNTNNGNSGNSSANNGKGGNGKNNGNVGNKGNSGNGNGNSNSGNGNSSDNSTGNGNATNAETNNSQNQSGILFPIASETSDTESYLIGLIKTSGKEKNYELIEYINDVNREYAEVLVEQNINGVLDTAYVYGAAIGTGSDRLSLDRFDGSTGYYLYDLRGSVTGLTNEEGQIYQSYRYSVFGEITFGTPQYENEYTYNGESYNPNIKSQYLRARYYCVVTADFLTEDSYLGRITEPLTLNRYNYCLSNPMNYADPSGHAVAKGLWDLLFGDDGEEPTFPVAYPIPPTPTPKPTEVPVILPDGVEPYEQGILPNGGIVYVLEAIWRQTEQYVTELVQTPTQTTIEEQAQVVIENNNFDVCENPYAKFNMENYEELLAFEGENKNYEGFVAVAYVVLNRAIRDNMTISEVGETGAFSAYNPNYDINEINNEVKKAAEDVLSGKVENPIGDAYFFFGRVKGYDLWVEPDGCSYVKVVRGNVFYTYDDYGKVHNKYPFNDFDSNKQMVIYNVSLENGKWIYDGLLIENGKVVVDRNVEDEAK